MQSKVQSRKSKEEVEGITKTRPSYLINQRGVLMSYFGFLSPLISESTSAFQRLLKILPERWRFYRGPLRTGTITATLFQRQVQGWGWKLPYKPIQVWDDQYRLNLWRKLLTELESKKIKVVGLEAGSSFHPPMKLATEPSFPGVSDGKAIELLFFINRFRRLLQNYGIAPGRTKALIIWEEGNLGLTCARLIAREIRFLTLISPNQRLLERAADIITAETGIVPQIYTELPDDYQGAKVVIKCGRLTRYHLYRGPRRVIICELFPYRPNIANINLGLPLDILTEVGQLPIYPALGEVVLRSCFEINMGHWYGTELPLERVIKLAFLFKELGLDISL
jgi:hypothetical protein